MAKGNFEACALITLGYEGGLTMDRRDPGNWTGGKVGKGELHGTNMGIAANTFPNEDIKGMTKARAITLYKPRYWDAIQGDALPFGFDLMTYDFGVNSGPSRGVKELQRAVGAGVDGKMGGETIAKAVRAASNGKAVIQKMAAGRMSFLRGLAVWKTFKRGWTSRVANVEAKAVAMWLNVRSTPAVAKAILKDEAEKAGKVSSTQQRSATGTATAGGGLGAGDVVMTGDINWLLIGGIAAAVIVVAGLLILKARQNKERARAYLDAAA